MIQYMPGDYLLVPMSGTTGRLIRFGQWLNGDGFSNYEHAAVYIGNGEIVEAAPGGARVAKLREYDLRSVVWSTGSVPLTPAQRTAVWVAALRYVGTPYSFADYAAIAAHRFRLPVPGLRGYVASTHHMICSQLVAQCYRDAGVELFPGNPWPGYVTPGALFDRLSK